MYILRLYHQSDPTRQIETRPLESGELVVGRDPGAGWKIDDPDRQISRAHCTLILKSGSLYVRDTSSNGMSFGHSQKRLAPNQVVPMELGETLLLGQFIIAIELAKPDSIFPEANAPIRAKADLPSDSPFAPPAGFDSLQGISSPAKPDPFASELKASPLEADPFAADPLAAFDRNEPARKGLAPNDEDVWNRRDPGKVGDWNGPSAHRAVGHEALIGSDRQWSEPPSDGPSEVGFGFDAPFHRPMLKAEPVSAAALVIPSDWDQVEPAKVPEPASTPAAPEPHALAPVEPPSPARVLPSLDELLAMEIPPKPQPRVEHETEFLPNPDASLPLTPPPAANIPVPPEPIAPPKAEPVAAPEPIIPQQIIPDPVAAPIVPPVVAATPPPPPAKPAPKLSPAESASADMLFRAFCAGANLDPAEFEGEDHAALLQRAGAIYQQMVLGLGDLLGERTSLKNEYRMARTSVTPEGNNPFKWAPARRVAVDLLRGANEGFLTGPAAVRESFSDLKKHLLCLLAGMRASLASTLRALSPAGIDAKLRNQSFVMKASKGAAAWSEYGRVYAEFQKQADDNPDSQINRDFRTAYEQQLGELDGLAAKQ
ncbi:hypothetical protein BH11PSE2_BH11PSE2_19240 [soil metagenome]